MQKWILKCNNIIEIKDGMITKAFKPDFPFQCCTVQLSIY